MRGGAQQQDGGQVIMPQMHWVQYCVVQFPASYPAQAWDHAHGLISAYQISTLVFLVSLHMVYCITFGIVRHYMPCMI